VRLWTVHPRYLDARGLVALWRETLLARAVLGGVTRGYTRHPQLDRFRSDPQPSSAINHYLAAVLDEARARGYRFDARKVGPVDDRPPIATTQGQLDHEWAHLLAKLQRRSPSLFRRWRAEAPRAHPLFRIVPGAVEPWERAQGVSSLARTHRTETRMTAFNVVRFRVKPGSVEAFIEAHRKMRPTLKGFIDGSLVRTGDQTFCLVGEWRSFQSIVDARPKMISMLDGMRAMLEDLGGGLGVTDPVSGESVLRLGKPKAAKKRAAKRRGAAKGKAATKGKAGKGKAKKAAAAKRKG